MKNKILSTIKQHLNLCIFTFLLLSQSTSCEDPNYLACEPKTCGNQTIKFPFYIEGKQNPSCGFPGFNISCHEYTPILQKPENSFKIQEISYDNQSLHLLDTAILNLKNGCFPKTNNISLDPDKFEILPIFSNMFLLSNCSSYPSNLSEYKIGCDEKNTYGNGLGFAMFEGQESLSYVMGICKLVVLAKVELRTNDGIMNYLEVLKRGIAVKWIASDCGVCETSGGRCGFDEPSHHFRCFCPDRPHIVSCNSAGVKVKRNKTVILATAILGAAILLFCLLVLVIKFPKKIKFRSKNDKEVEDFIKQHGSFSPKRYTYVAIKKMTKSFETKLGEGGYGNVFKGKLKNGTNVAVKILKESKGSREEFINEVITISGTSHVNIVSLLGYCFEGQKRALIYEFMSNGSLEKFICHKNSMKHKLGWDVLYKITIGIARGLEYLHSGCNNRILHFDIKPHNILLDDDLCPKISDFGLAKLCPPKQSNISLLDARGTIGYVAPEVFSRNFGRVSHKSDVYSFGMMVLEMVGGRETRNLEGEVGHTSDIYFPAYIYKRLEQNELGLHGITNEEENRDLRKLIIVGLWCIQTDPTHRPSISKVVEMLERRLEALEIPPKTYLSSTTPFHIEKSFDSSSTSQAITDV